MSPAVEAQSPNHWTTREFPPVVSLKLISASLDLESGNALIFKKEEYHDIKSLKS